MSSWDAPTGSWDSHQEPDESGGPEGQGYQQGEPTGGYRTVPGGEGRLRAGRRGLPGYDAGSDYGSEPGQQPGFGSGPGGGPMVRYGQQPADEPAFGSGSHRTGGPGPLSSPPSQGPPTAPSPLAAPGAFGSVSSGPPRPLGSATQDPLASGPQSAFSSGPRRAIGS